MIAALSKKFSDLKPLPFFIVTALFLCLWYIPVPEGLNKQAWNLFAIFISTIVGIVMRPLPIGALAILSMLVAVLTKTLTLNQALNGFSDKIVWLIVFAFFISRGFIETGLGRRIAYFFISILGRSTLGLAYGLVTTEFLLSPLIPSVTARGGGIIFPIAKSLLTEYGGEPDKRRPNRTGSYLIQVCFQSNVITSAIFLTAMAGNPLIVKLAGDAGITITWTTWALGAIVPGLISLYFLPLFLYVFHPPLIKSTPQAPEAARQKLEEMGPMSFKEIVMLFTFIGLIALWILGDRLDIDATTTAMVGCVALILLGVISWEDAINEKGAWKTLIWFAILLMMAGYLSSFGLITWLSNHIQQVVHGFDRLPALLLLGLIFFYIHYFFASITAHITVMYSAFLVVFIALNVPPLVAALGLGFLSVLSGGLTNYGIGTAPVFFGSGYVRIRDWWLMGFLVSVVNLLIWGTTGFFWWKFLGWF